MQSIELGNDSVRGYAHIDAAGFGRLEGTIEGTGEAIVFNGALGFNETNKWLPAEVLEYELPLTMVFNVRYTISIRYQALSHLTTQLFQERLPYRVPFLPGLQLPLLRTS